MKEKVIKSGVISVIGAILSIVPIMGYYPFVGAFAVAVMSSYCLRLPTIVAMLAAMVWRLDIVACMKYSLILLALAIVIKLLEEKGSRMNSKVAALIGSVTVLLMETTDMLGTGIHSGEILIITGLVLLTFSGGLLFHLFLGIFISSGRRIHSMGKKKKQMEDFFVYEERLRDIGDSFIRLSKMAGDTYFDNNSDSVMDTFNNEDINNILKGDKNEDLYIENKIIANQKQESRKLLSMYLKETGKIIKGISNETNKLVKTDEDLEENIAKNISEMKIHCMDVRISEDKGKKQITVKMRKKGGSYITLASVANNISSVMNKKYVIVGDRKFLDNKMEIYTFVEDTNYFVMHGIAKKSINSSSSGDNYTCINLDSGQTLLSISDGMGTGSKASRESSQVVELIEEFMECGYSEELTLKLINSMFVAKGNMCPATVDMSIIDMHSGMCGILKSGAATTYVKRDRWVEAIKSTSLPIGVMESVDMEATRKKLYDGDFVIMVSDGILESIEDTEKDKVISDIILSAKSKKPKDLAYEILNTVCEKAGSIISDDMTVLVTGIWDKFA